MHLITVMLPIHKQLTDACARATELFSSGRYAAATEHLQHALEAGAATLGNRSLELVPLLNQLGIIGKYTGDYSGAEHYYARALAIAEAHDEGGDSETIASLLHNIAGLAQANGQPERAAPMARRGLQIRYLSAEPDPVAIAADEAALAAILIDLGDMSQAEPLLIRTITTYRSWHGPDHYEVGVALHNLGSLQLRTGRPAIACQTLAQALRIKEGALSTEHPELAITLHNLARAKTVLGQAASAKRLYQRAISLLERVVAPDHRTLIACKQRLMECELASPRSADGNADR